MSRPIGVDVVPVSDRILTRVEKSREGQNTIRVQYYNRKLTPPWKNYPPIFLHGFFFFVCVEGNVLFTFIQHCTSIH